MYIWGLKYTPLFQNKAHHRSLENAQRTKPHEKKYYLSIVVVCHVVAYVIGWLSLVIVLSSICSYLSLYLRIYSIFINM